MDVATFMAKVSPTTNFVFAFAFVSVRLARERARWAARGRHRAGVGTAPEPGPGAQAPRAGAGGLAGLRGCRLGVHKLVPRRTADAEATFAYQWTRESLVFQ